MSDMATVVQRPARVRLPRFVDASYDVCSGSRWSFRVAGVPWPRARACWRSALRRARCAKIG